MSTRQLRLRSAQIRHSDPENLFSNSQYQIKIGPVWSMNAGIEANVLCKPRKNWPNLPLLTKMIIGPICTEAAIAAAEEATAAQVLLIAPAATHPLVTVDGKGDTRNTVFRISYSAAWQGAIAAKFGATQNIQRAAIFYTGESEYSTTLAEAFHRNYNIQGGTIVYSTTLPTELEELTPLLTITQQQAAELIYLPVEVARANQIASELNTTLPETVILGSDKWDTPNLDLSVTTGHVFPVQYTLLNPYPAVENWRTEYKEAYAVEPDTLAALGFDAASMLAQALENTPHPTPVNVAKTLEAMEYDGVSGHLHYDGRHDPQKSVSFVTVTNQNAVTLVDVISP
jgi:branched-chain amino acid transport system substrate-binding protein